MGESCRGEGREERGGEGRGEGRVEEGEGRVEEGEERVEGRRGEGGGEEMRRVDRSRKVITFSERLNPRLYLNNV